MFAITEPNGTPDPARGLNDRLVAIYSQRFKIYNNTVSLFEQVDHVKIHDNEEPINNPISGVKFILEVPITSERFLMPN